MITRLDSHIHSSKFIPLRTSSRSVCASNRAFDETIRKVLGKCSWQYNRQSWRANINIRRLYCLIVVVLLAFSTNSKSTQAQSPAPLYLVISGDLWSWTPPNGSPKQLTNWGANFSPIISPDGKWLAYYSYPQFVVDNFKNCMCQQGPDFPQNIWLMNLRTGISTKIADQPTGATFADDQHSRHYTLRNAMIWTKDSTELIWLETTIPSDTNPPNSLSMVAFNPTTQKKNIIVKDLPGAPAFHEGDSTFSTLAVDENSLTVLVDKDITGGGSKSPGILLTYDRSGKLLTKIPLDDTNCPCYNPTQVRYKNNNVIAVQHDYSLPGTLLIDLENRQKLSSTNRWEYYAPSFPDGLFLYFLTKDNSVVWTLVDPKRPEHQSPIVDSFTFSPNTDQLAYTTNGQLYLYQNGQIQPVGVLSGKTVSDVVWGPTAIRLN